MCDRYGIGDNSKLAAQILISSIKRGYLNKEVD